LIGLIIQNQISQTGTLSGVKGSPMLISADDFAGFDIAQYL
jgi:hypothetical protein